MINKHNKTAGDEDYKTLYAKYSDSQIMDVLKKRNLYRPEAAELAIEIAIKRKLINSVEDLEQYDSEHKTLKKSLFPKIEKEKTKIKLRKSLSLNLLIISFLPIFWSLILFRMENYIEGSIVLFIGLAWATLTLLNRRKIRNEFIFSMFGLLVIGLIYTIYIIISEKLFEVMYIISFSVLFIFAFYGLIYLYKLGKMTMKE